MSTTTQTRSVKLKLVGAFIALVTMMYYGSNLLPYITGSRAVTFDRDKSQHVDLIVSWVPNRDTHISWAVGDDGDDHTQWRSQWHRGHRANTGDVILLAVTSKHAGEHGYVRCMIKVNYAVVRGPTQENNACELRYVVPPKP